MSSKRAQRRKACTGKRAYATPAEAQTGLLVLRRRAYPADAPLDCYHCPHCRAWHIGHRPGQRKHRHP